MRSESFELFRFSLAARSQPGLFDVAITREDYLKEVFGRQGAFVHYNHEFHYQRLARLHVRWHDLRHTCCTRLLEQGVSLPIVGQILGWAPSTTVRMAQRYGHIGQEA